MADNEHKKWFEKGEMVASSDGTKSWKHRIWRNIAREDLTHVHAAASYYYNCDKDQQRISQNPDGTYNFEAVYGASGNSRYRLEDWDGTCVIGPNRRELGQQWPIDSFVLYIINDTKLVGTIKRHSRKTMTVWVEGHVTCDDEGHIKWDIPEGRQRWWRIPWRLVDEALIEKVDR